jgi:hypothetical protein
MIMPMNLNCVHLIYPCIDTGTLKQEMGPWMSVQPHLTTVVPKKKKKKKKSIHMNLTA